jgi:hypothetical protein
VAKGKTVLLAMSRQTIDLGMAGRLRKLAADFHKQAEAFERQNRQDFEPSQSTEKVVPIQTPSFDPHLPG